MLIIHLSDLHLSRYGEPVTWTLRADDEEERWEALHQWSGWQIEGLRDRKGRPDDLRLIDPEDIVHKVRSWPSRNDDKAISALLGVAMDRQRYSSQELVRSRPTAEDLQSLRRVDPENTNLRFMQLLGEVEAHAPEVVLITGDITNNGYGYELIQHYLAPWVERGTLFAVPGNHDTYDMLPRMGRSRRTQAKEECYAEFARSVDLLPGEEGAYLRLFGDMAVVGLNSCQMPKTPLSASGAVSKDQLRWLERLGQDPEFSACRVRVALVHHHLLRVPYTVGNRNPMEAGMRLRNAVDTMEMLTQANLDFVFNGHRHHGYVVKLPGRPMIISSPSSTLGCKSTGTAYTWRLDLADEQPFPVLLPLSLSGPEKE